MPKYNYTIPIGTTVWIPNLGIQRDPEYFPDPDKFDPERFSDKNILLMNPMTNLPFGDGPRNCIGSRFGMMQTRVGLVCLLRHFEFSACSETPVPHIEFSVVDTILTPKGGQMWLSVNRVSERNGL